jgi:trehalose 6-phosphate synthase
MLALLDPSRQDIPEYAEYLGAIQRAARTVNDRFQRDGWVPLELVIQDNFPQAVAAYKQFDVLLVNSIFDGMNLVAKEYVAAQDPADPGVLILSRFAGAAEQMTDALLVNPHSAEELSDALGRALAMPLAERVQRWTSLMADVERRDVMWWLDRFTDALAQVPAAA